MFSFLNFQQTKINESYVLSGDDVAHTQTQLVPTFWVKVYKIADVMCSWCW